MPRLTLFFDDAKPPPFSPDPYSSPHPDIPSLPKLLFKLYTFPFTVPFYLQQQANRASFMFTALAPVCAVAGHTGPIIDRSPNVAQEFEVSACGINIF